MDTFPSLSSPVPDDSLLEAFGRCAIPLSSRSRASKSRQQIGYKFPHPALVAIATCFYGQIVGFSNIGMGTLTNWKEGEFILRGTKDLDSIIMSQIRMRGLEDEQICVRYKRFLRSVRTRISPPLCSSCGGSSDCLSESEVLATWASLSHAEKLGMGIEDADLSGDASCHGLLHLGLFALSCH